MLLNLRNVDETVAGNRRAAASRGRDVDAGDRAGFEAIDRGAELRQVRNLRARHFADDVAFIEDVAGRRDFLDARHHDAGDVVGDSVALARLRRQLLHGHPQFVARRRCLLGLLRRVFLVGFERALDRRCGQRLALAAADDGEIDLAADRKVRDVVDQRAVAGDRTSVSLDDDVAGLEAGFGGRKARLDGLHERAAGVGRQLESGAGVFGEIENAHAEIAARDLALLELRQETLRGIDRSGEAEALRAAAADGRVDADHLAIDVHERTAGVAEVDGGVSLDEVLEGTGGVAEAERASLGRDDADGERVFELERIADGDGPVTLADAVGVAQRNARQRLAGLDLEEGDVGGRIAADDLRIARVAAIAVLVGAPMHLHLARAFDDVIIGDDVAVRRNDEAGSAGDLLALVVFIGRAVAVRTALAVALARAREEELERIAAERTLLAEIGGFDDFGRRDRDDGRHDAGRHVGEGRDGDRGDGRATRGGLDCRRLRVRRTHQTEVGADYDSERDRGDDDRDRRQNAFGGWIHDC